MNLKSKKERREQMTSQNLASGRARQNDAPQSQAPQGLTPLEFAQQGLKPTRAFSVAEAMIALLIGSLILGFSAPMITKQLKHNNFTSIQTQILNKKIENVDDKSDANAEKISQIIGTRTPIDYAIHISELEADIARIESTLNYDEDIKNLQTQLAGKVDSSDLDNSVASKVSTEVEKMKKELENEIKKKTIPSGTIAFFDLPACPDGWAALSSTYAGRFPRFTGSFEVSNTSYAPAGATTTKTTITINKGTTGNDAIRNITGWYRGTDAEGYGLASSAWGITGGVFSQGNWTGTYRVSKPAGSGVARDFYFKASSSVPTAAENRPRFIGLLGCRKN